MKKRIVYLFGAGAVMDWKAPSTGCLTKLICKSGVKCKDSDKYVTQFIFEKLTTTLPEDEVNFETILNAIEELMVYYSSSDYKKHSSIIYPLLQIRTELDVIFNYTIKNKPWGHSGGLIIPDMEEEWNKLGALNGQTSHQFYLELLYKELISTICDEISSYSYHTASHSVIDKQTDLNNQFVNWIKSHKNAIHRLYTLNYDRLFSILLKQNGINTFEGEEFGSGLTPDENYPFDIKRIATDFETDCFYNIHGSAFWEVHSRNQYQLPNVSFSMNGAPNLMVNESSSSWVEMEKGKWFLVTNFISGYQKTQKLSISPFRQIQSAFDRDTLTADKLYLIGYSFGDTHINEMIRVATIHNPDIEIEIVKRTYEGGLEKKVLLNIWSDTNFQPEVKQKSFADFLKDYTMQ